MLDSLPAEAKIILTVANLVKRKCHDTVIEALPQLLRHEPAAYCVIVGEGQLYGRPLLSPISNAL